MIYIICCSSRVRKTNLAQRILEAKNIPYVSTDFLVHMLKNAAPDLKVTDKINFEEKADNFFPFLEQFIKYASNGVKDYLIEGDAFLPNHIAKLSQKFKLKSCFLGFSEMNIETIKKHAGLNNWVNELSDEEQSKLPEWLINLSEKYKSESLKFGFEYFDLSAGYEDQINKAFKYLVSEI